MSNYKHYAGIGSRKTPKNILNMMTKIAEYLANKNYVLRSGGASGADTAFEGGADLKVIFIPWRGFNGHKCPVIALTNEAIQMAQQYHPAPQNLSEGALKLMARNCYQVLGTNLKCPVNFVICWTPDGKASGGTGQAIRIAQDYNIKVYNLKNEEDFDYWQNLLNDKG